MAGKLALVFRYKPPLWELFGFLALDVETADLVTPKLIPEHLVG